MRRRRGGLVAAIPIAMLVSAGIAGASTSACGKASGASARDGGAPSATVAALLGDGGTAGAAPGPNAAGDGGAAVASTSPGGVGDAGAGMDEAIPSSTAPDLTARGKHLLEAIAHDSPELAADMVFPRDAFTASRDQQDPAKTWDRKLYPAFQRDVHTLAKRMKEADKAQFVSFEIGHSVDQITPKKREWKKPLWKVRHSKLTYTVDGKTMRIEVGEMTSWRGAWYVTKLR